MVIKMFLNYLRTNKTYNLASHLCDVRLRGRVMGQFFKHARPDAYCLVVIGQLVYSKPMFKYIPKIYKSDIALRPDAYCLVLFPSANCIFDR